MQWHPCMHYKTNKLNNISSMHHGRDLSLAIHKEQKGLYKLCWNIFIYLIRELVNLSEILELQSS
jgi:hypothetical protein